MMVLIGGKRYDLWWYLQRVVLVCGYLSVFFGLLSEYIRLLQRESEGRRLLDAILENVPIGLAVTDGPPHFSITRVSRHGLEMNQRSAEQLVGSPSGANQTSWRIFLPKEGTPPAPEQMPLYRASQFGEEIRNAEFEMEAEDGRRVPVLVSASPIRDTQGNIIAAINAWLDITDRKRAEEVLLESEALYRAIARSIPNGGIFVVDRNLRYIIAEGSVMESYGYSREILEGHIISDVLDAESAARMQARLQRVFAGETLSYETEHKGHIYWTQYALMKESLGYAIIITLDITERKQVERALSESEQRLRAIVNQATAGIVSSTVDGRTILVNQAFCGMLGLEESELLGKTIWELLHSDEIEETRRLFNRLVEKATPFQIESRFVRRDGSILWANVSASPILDALGKPESSVAVIVDVSERKQAESDLQKLNLELESRVEQRTIELQIANRALLDGRRRLQVLSQRLVEVQEDERRALARELHDRVGQTLTALNLNLTIVNDQLSHQALPPVNSRLSDSIKLVTEMISIVRDVMSDLRPVVLDEYGLEAALNTYVTKFATRYGIRVEFIRPNLPIPSLGAAMEMTVLRIVQEALLNIARHAQANHVLVSIERSENALQLTIQDNGVGIPSSQQAKQLRGHGLMIMQERAEAVGGTLEVSSTPGKGTRIESILPFQADIGEKGTEEHK
jgi:PAS domain S-box-containing protein